MSLPSVDVVAFFVISSPVDELLSVVVEAKGSRSVNFLFSVLKMKSPNIDIIIIIFIMAVAQNFWIILHM